MIKSIIGCKGKSFSTTKATLKSLKNKKFIVLRLAK